MPEEARDGADEAENEKDLAAHQACDQRTDVGGEIHELDVAARRAHVELGKIAENEQQERPGAGPVEAVVRADDEGGEVHDRHLLFGLDVAALLRQLPLAQHDEGHDRQHDEQQIPKCEPTSASTIDGTPSFQST